MTGYLGMSDEDFEKSEIPDAPARTEDAAPVQENKEATEPPASETPETNEATESQNPPEGSDTLSGGESGDKADEAKTEDATQKEDPNQTDEATLNAKPPEAAPKKVSPPKTGTPAGEVTQPDPKTGTQDPSKDATKKDGEKEAPAPGQAPDYEAFYKQVMTPFQANGKKIELKSPAEAVQLMQMGANYTRKMQELAPHRKVLLMLQNNGLLDEGKLTYLIDLDKKNPEAVKKLVKDSGIDPQDIDTSVEPAYREGNHRVTDAEANFRSTMDEVKSMPKGTETLTVINTDWDQASKDKLWDHPEVMTLIHQQRENGIYDRISSEVHRLRTLGQIGPDVPFLQAYTQVGDKLAAENAFAPPVAQKVAPPAVPVPVATRAAAPKPTVTNSDRAAAASPTRTSPKPAQTNLNPLAMSDEDFEKLMVPRV